MPNYTFTDFDVQNSGLVEPRSINGSGDVVGFYIDAFGQQHGFSYENGVAATVDVPGAQSTRLLGINASGEIIGTTDSSNANIGSQGFTDIDGHLQAIVIPGSVNLSATSINDFGQITGSYTDTATDKQHGFIYKDGQYTSIDVSGANGTFADYINNAAEVIGYYTQTNGDNVTLGHYFLRSAAGGEQPIDVPGAQDGTTRVQGLNNLGEIAGEVNDGAAHYGFVENNGAYTTFGIPGAVFLEVSGINDSGVVTGYYEDASSQGHAFVEKDGVVTLVADPQHPNILISAINNAGELTGYSDQNGIDTGFVAVLTPPAIAGTIADQSATGTAPVTPFATATLTDPNGSTETLTISLSGGGGTLGGAGLASNADGTSTLSGSATAVTQQLEALRFTPAGGGAPGSSSTTRFTLSDVSDLGTSATDSTTTVIDTVPGAASTTTSPSGPSSTTSSSAPNAVSLSSQASYKDGVFTLRGMASSAAGIGSVEISAVLDGGARVDLGAATVGANGDFDFADLIGAHQQGFLEATLTDKAGVQTVSEDPLVALTGGLGPNGGAGRETRFTRDGSSPTAVTRFAPSGTESVSVLGPGQTFASSYDDVFLNDGRAGTSFVFDPGFSRDVVGGFRIGGAGHDTLSFQGADFGGTPAARLGSLLANSYDGGAGLVIVDPSSQDVVQLNGLTKSQLIHNARDITFR